MERTIKIALFSLAFNTSFATYNLVLGFIEPSWWFLSLGSYYLILSAVRFAVLITKRSERFITGFTSWMLMLLSIPLAGIVILSVVRDRGRKFHIIVMIAIATYAFTKISVAAINWFKSKRGKSVKHITLRNVSLADAFVSIFALQRSMLVSFEGMTESEIQTMNALLGFAVCIIVFLLGRNLKKTIDYKNED